MGAIQGRLGYIGTISGIYRGSILEHIQGSPTPPLWGSDVWALNVYGVCMGYIRTLPAGFLVGTEVACKI